jgi:hypothetical protein
VNIIEIASDPLFDAYSHIAPLLPGANGKKNGARSGREV